MSDPLNDIADLEALRLLHEQSAAEVKALQAANDALTEQLTRLEHDNVLLTTEVEVLLKRISELTILLAKAKDADQQLELGLELKRVTERLAAMNDEKFGSSRSERRGRTDGGAPKPNGTDKTNADKPNPKKPQTGHGPTEQLSLPIVEKHHQLAGDACACGKCEGELVEMPGQTEDSDLISVERVKYVVKRHKRHKYRCRQCGDIATAPGPVRLVDGGRYDLEFAAQVAVDKYKDHIPLEAQVDRMAREGLVVTSQTLFDQLCWIYLLLLPTWLAGKVRILSRDRVHADETRWRMIGKGASQRWWVWCLVNDVGVHFELYPTRGSAAAKALLNGYDGVVVADGYGVYASLEGARDKQGPLLPGMKGEGLPLPNFTLAGCWAHARRPFKACEKSIPEASEVLDLIGELASIEAEAVALAKDDEAALFEHRRHLRDTKSRAVVAKIKAWCDAQRPLPGMKFAKGVRYLKNQWRPLTLFLDDPEIPLTNNEAERAVRGPVRGRKVHHGSHSERGARVAALLYSLMETCRLLGVNPTDWLITALRRARADRTAVTLPSDYAAGEFDAT